MEAFWFRLVKKGEWAKGDGETKKQHADAVGLALTRTYGTF